MPVWDTLEAVGEGLNAARDLVAADPNTLNPVENLAREGLRAYCRSQEWIDGNIPLGASVGGAYVCDPLWNEPGNSPPSGGIVGGQCAVEYVLIYRRLSTFFSDFCEVGNGDSGPVEANVTGPLSNLRAERYGDAGDCGGLKGARWLIDTGLGTVTLADSIQSPGRTAVSVEFISVSRVDGLPDDCGSEGSGPPNITNPYAPGTPLPTPYGPITVEPKPWGPRVFPPIGPPIDIPFDPLEPLPDPTNRDRPEDGPVTPAPDPAPAPDDDGAVDFGNPPDGFVFVGLAWEVRTGASVLGEILGTAADIISPSILGNVRLRVQNGDLTVSTPFFKVNTETGYIIRECAGLNVVGANVNSINGVEITITPLLAEVVDDSEE